MITKKDVINLVESSIFVKNVQVQENKDFKDYLITIRSDEKSWNSNCKKHKCEYDNQINMKMIDIIFQIELLLDKYDEFLNEKEKQNKILTSKKNNDSIKNVCVRKNKMKINPNNRQQYYLEKMGFKIINKERSFISSSLRKEDNNSTNQEISTSLILDKNDLVNLLELKKEEN